MRGLLLGPHGGKWYSETSLQISGACSQAGSHRKLEMGWKASKWLRFTFTVLTCALSLLFINPLIQEILINHLDHLLQGRNSSRCWGYSNEKESPNSWDEIPPGNSGSATDSGRWACSSFKMHIFVKSTDSQHPGELNQRDCLVSSTKFPASQDKLLWFVLWCLSFFFHLVVL